MTKSETKTQARQNLTAKWGKASLTTILFLIILCALSRILHFIPAFQHVLFWLLSIPLIYGFAQTMFELNDDLPTTCLSFLKNGFANFTKIWSIAFYIISKLILPISLIFVCILLSVYGIVNEYALLKLFSFIFYLAAIIYLLIKQLTYKLAIFVSLDHPEMTGKEVVQKTEELMKGNVWSLFCFDLSFIGWVILTVFTLGLGLLWLIPYKVTSDLNFYRNLTGEIVVKEK